MKMKSRGTENNEINERIEESRAENQLLHNVQIRLKTVEAKNNWIKVKMSVLHIFQVRSSYCVFIKLKYLFEIVLFSSRAGERSSDSCSEYNAIELFYLINPVECLGVHRF